VLKASIVTEIPIINFRDFSSYLIEHAFFSYYSRFRSSSSWEGTEGVMLFIPINSF